MIVNAFKNCEKLPTATEFDVNILIIYQQNASCL